MPRDSIAARECPPSPTKRRYLVVDDPSRDENSRPQATDSDDLYAQNHGMELGRTRRKSVTFSSVDMLATIPKLQPERARRPDKLALQVTTNAEHDPSRRTSMIPPKHPQPVLDDRTGSLAPSSPRKRRYSNVAPSMPVYESPADPAQEYDEDQPSPRKRRFSTAKPQLTRPAPPNPRAVLMQPSIIPPPEFVPPSTICATVNKRVQSEQDQASFDFAVHVQHRTYIVRALPLLSPNECVTMLDAGVDGLLPDSFSTSPSVDFRDNFVIGKAPGKGLGMFAERHIRCNEVILVEHPVVVIPLVLGVGVPLSEVCADVFKRLSKPVRQQVMDLLFAAPGSGSDNDDYDRVFQLNALAISLSVPEVEFAELSTHRGIFLQTSRCNHSCGPNAMWEWNRDLFCLTLTAVRPINPSDEITVAYIPVGTPFHIRREKLFATYDFECLCEYCIQPVDDIHRSDAARAKLATFWDSDSSFRPSFEDWCLDPSIPDDAIISAHKHALRLIESEGLEVMVSKHAGSGQRKDHPMRSIGRHVDAIAMCYGALEDFENFMKWIGKAMEAREVEWPEQRLAFRKWMSNPMAFPVWGWRKTFCADAVASFNGARVKKRDLDDGGDDSMAGLVGCVKMGMFDFV